MKKSDDPYSRQKRYYQKNKKKINEKHAARDNYLRKLGLVHERECLKKESQSI